MAVVEVDIALGTVQVLRIVAAHDVGRAINPTLVEGQIHGGIAQGLGLALMEEYLPGRTENLHDYLIPTIGDIPPIETILIEGRDPLGPYGAKGVGEPALIADRAGDPRRHRRTPPACASRASRRRPTACCAALAAMTTTHADPAAPEDSRRWTAGDACPSRASSPAMPARCCAASGPARPAPATATAMSRAGWSAWTR